MFSSNKLDFVALMVALFLVLMFSGTPDLLDTLVYKLSEGKLVCTSNEFSFTIPK